MQGELVTSVRFFISFSLVQGYFCAFHKMFLFWKHLEKFSLMVLVSAAL